ncbi:MAG: hypothetical protein J1F18_03310 [Lachnospiraceae bacterium]|nr:hypothetical protein [Lachnospiraceae bacterium]
MIKIDIEQSTLEELINYHTNYIKETVSKNWNQIVGKTVDKVKVTKSDLVDINVALNRELAKKSRIKSGNLLLQNIVEICITQNLKKYAIPSEVLFPQSTEKYVNILLEIIGYRKFNKGDVTGEYNNGIVWNRHNFVQKLNVRVCPYCNRQYITSFYKNDRKVTTADVDHYYPKTQYPLLSMNFFNLIPCCSVCNSGLKGRKKMGIEDITLNPFFDDSDSLLFQVNDDELEEMYNFRNSDTKISIDINTMKNNENQKRAENSAKIFYLSEIYHAHIKEVETIRENMNHFSKEYFEKVLQKNYNGLFDDYDEFRKVIFNFNYLNDGDEPLVKLKKDIYHQLNFDALKDE